MENKDYNPFGIEWEREISKLTIPQIVLLFNVSKNKKEKKPDFIKRIGKIKLEEFAENTGYYIISLIRTLRHDEFVVLWANEGRCTSFKENASIYIELDPLTHDSDKNIPVNISIAKNLFVERLIDGKRQFVIPNVKSTWEKLGVEMKTLHLEKI